jgi:tetratricopeptide (TPR) repeat protein
MASLLTEEEKNNEAIGYLEQALNMEGDIEEVYYNLAIRYAIRQEYDKAVNAIESCLKIDPNYPNAAVWKKDFLERTSLDEMHTASAL